MKVLIDATVFEQEATGIAKATLFLYNHCVEQIPTMEVEAIHRRPLCSFLGPNIASIEYKNYLPQYLWRRLALPTYVYRSQPTLVHFPWNGDIPTYMPNSKVIMTLHDVLPLILPNYFSEKRQEISYRQRIQKDISRSDLVITDSEFSRDQIIENFDLNTNLAVIHLGPTLPVIGEQQLTKKQDQKNSNYFLFVGGYHPRKGILALLRIFITLYRQKKIRNKLILVGQPIYFSPELQRLAEEGVLLNAVEEVGYVSDDMLVNLYSEATCLIYPSKFEGFGLPLLEAMSLGCPVITTRGTSIPEVCGNAAYYIDPDVEEDFANALITIENDSELRERLRKDGIIQAKTFSWSQSAKTFLDEVAKISD